jgi:uncharacterized membrane protein YqaE (UPF0057 family)
VNAFEDRKAHFLLELQAPPSLPETFSDPFAPFNRPLFTGVDRGWDGKKLLIYVLIALVLSLFFWIPGIIFAFLVYLEIV